MKTRINTFVRDYCTFSKPQRRALFILLSLSAAAFLFPPLYHYFIGNETQPADALVMRQVRELRVSPGESPEEQYAARRYNYDREDYTAYREPEHHARKAAKYELFEFDPNATSATDWKRLGLRDKTIATIQNYLSKGGKFRQASDLKRVYGLFPDEAERLMPFVRIENNSHANNAAPPGDFPKPAYEKPVRNNTPVDINTADTTAFIALPGIGPKLAARIVSFRDKLGGFYSISQLGETFGLPDSTFQQIKPRLVLQHINLRKININTAGANGLKHIYLKWNVANAIIQYRNQHGPYTSVNDIKKIMLVDETLFTKISPYLTVE